MPCGQKVVIWEFSSFLLPSKLEWALVYCPEAFFLHSAATCSYRIKQGLSSWQISSSEWKKIGNISTRWYLPLCSQKPICLIFIGNHSKRKIWMKILVCWRFLDQIRLQKTGFWTNIEKHIFFNAIFKYLTNYKNCCWQHVRFVL